MELINDDCFNVFPQIDDGSIDLILCDLPYGTTQNKWDSVLPLDKLGSGTTGVACKNTNRNFVGVEKDLEYFNIAKQRILNMSETEGTT